LFFARLKMRPTVELLAAYFTEAYGADPGSLSVEPLERGSHGVGYRAAFTEHGHNRTLIVKSLDGSGLGHDYSSDRAAVLLLARDTYGRLPDHVKAVDVLARSRGDDVFSIDGGEEYYLVMEEARGKSYFDGLRKMAGRAELESDEKATVIRLARYLAGIHSEKKDAPSLYLRKVRDTIGHGECLMGVLDTYGPSAGFTNPAEMTCIEKACIEWRARLKMLTGRLSVTHGDFHPGNIIISQDGSFTLLDRSRGEYGEPADDLTALAINFIMLSFAESGRMAGAYLQAAVLFFEEYITASGDEEVMSVCAPFFAFRGVVVANPLFYPDLDDAVRNKIFGFIHGVLKADTFSTDKINEYMDTGSDYRKLFFNKV